jgi:hypothetical protein
MPDSQRASVFGDGAFFAFSRLSCGSRPACRALAPSLLRHPTASVQTQRSRGIDSYNSSHNATRRINDRVPCAFHCYHALQEHLKKKKKKTKPRQERQNLHHSDEHLEGRCVHAAFRSISCENKQHLDAVLNQIDLVQ